MYIICLKNCKYIIKVSLFYSIITQQMFFYTRDAKNKFKIKIYIFLIIYM